MHGFLQSASELLMTHDTFSKATATLRHARGYLSGHLAVSFQISTGPHTLPSITFRKRSLTGGVRWTDVGESGICRPLQDAL